MYDLRGVAVCVVKASEIDKLRSKKSLKNIIIKKIITESSWPISCVVWDLDIYVQSESPLKFVSSISANCEVYSTQRYVISTTYVGLVAFTFCSRFICK